MSMGDVLSKLCLALRSRKGSAFNFSFFLAACSAKTAALVGSSTQSSRRNTVKGRMTLP